MNGDQTVFTAEIAGIPVEIRARYPKNKDYFRDYLTGREAEITIEPSEDDIARVKESFRRADIAEGRGDRSYRLWYLENGAIHTLLAEALVQKNVLLMHGSALEMDGETYIFTAKSGTGKSTHTRLWREAFPGRCRMINDDKPMLRVESSGVTVFGTPWYGKHGLGCNARSPLKAIVSLERGETNSIIPLDASERFPLLLRQVFSSCSPENMRTILELESKLAASVPFYRLRCNMQPDAALTAWRGMNPGKPDPV